MLSPQATAVAISLGLTPEMVRRCGSEAGVQQLKDDVKKAYRQRALQTHPDRGGDVEEFKRLSAAYSEIEKYLEQLQYVCAVVLPRVKVTFVGAVTTNGGRVHFRNDWWNRAGS